MILRNRRFFILILAAGFVYGGYILFNHVLSHDEQLHYNDVDGPLALRGDLPSLLKVSQQIEKSQIKSNYLLLNITDSRTSERITSAVEVKKDKATAVISTKLNIILLSYMRSGTSFLGNIFQSNPDMFYIFEPYHAFNYLKAIGKQFPGDISDFEDQPTIAKGKLLENFLTCNFTYKMYFDYLNDVIRNRVYHSNLQIGLSRPLKELCAEIKHQSKSTECHKFTPENLGEKCKSYPYTALKVIRVSNISAYADIIRGTNTKVVHLVRDPRAMFYSRTRIGYGAKLSTKKKICNAMITNAQDRVGGPLWGDGVYIIVRYEDVAFSPEEASREIYKQIGITPHVNVIKWLNANTKNDPQKYASLTTNRNSTSAALHWRFDASWDLVSEVQSIEPCLRAMRLYGYHKLNNLEELRDLKIPSQTETLQELE